MIDPIELRLRRIEGQIAGIRKMYLKRRECLELSQQIGAVRAALAEVGKMVLSGEAIRCARSGKENERFARMIQTLFRIS